MHDRTDEDLRRHESVGRPICPQCGCIMEKVNAGTPATFERKCRTCKGQWRIFTAEDPQLRITGYARIG